MLVLVTVTSLPSVSFPVAEEEESGEGEAVKVLFVISVFAPAVASAEGDGVEETGREEVSEDGDDGVEGEAPRIGMLFAVRVMGSVGAGLVGDGEAGFCWVCGACVGVGGVDSEVLSGRMLVCLSFILIFLFPPSPFPNLQYPNPPPTPNPLP